MPDPTILRSITRHWWIFALRGLIAILFAVGAYLWPGLTLLILLLLWGVYVIADGITAVLVGAQTKWWSLVLFGMLAMCAGIIAVMRPDITAIALLTVIAAWAIFRGICDIVAAIVLRKEITNEWLMVVSGILSVAFGIMLILFPGAGALSLAWLISIYAFVFGIVLLIFAFRLRSWHHAAGVR